MNRFLISILLVVSLISCGDEVGDPIPSLEGVEVDWDIHRFDQDLKIASDDKIDADELAMLEGRYPKFSEIYFKHILPIKGDTPDDVAENLTGFLKDSSIIHLIDTTEMIFGDLSKVKTELELAFRFMKKYKPNFIAPDVYTFISEFGHQVFVFPDETKDGVGIGLDMFLGHNYPYERMAKENPAFSNYLTRTFTKEHITRKVMFAIIDDMAGLSAGNRLLDHMIHNGKKLYILDKVLPSVPDSIIVEYSTEQMEWVRESELGMWSFFFDQELFYETDMMKINKYINASPNSPGMPDGSPGRTANYMGWQIVKAYMKKYPMTGIEQLLKLSDAQLIMDKSRYKPKRR